MGGKGKNGDACGVGEKGGRCVVLIDMDTLFLVVSVIVTSPVLHIALVIIIISL